MTAFWAMGYFWMRVVHAFMTWFGIAYIRTVVFTLGWFCIVGMFWEVIR
jgi:hypothetical protein